MIHVASTYFIRTLDLVAGTSSPTFTTGSILYIERVNKYDCWMNMIVESLRSDKLEFSCMLIVCVLSQDLTVFVSSVFIEILNHFIQILLK